MQGAGGRLAVLARLATGWWEKRGTTQPLVEHNSCVWLVGSEIRSSCAIRCNQGNQGCILV